jgi:hypothetical protein
VAATRFAIVIASETKAIRRVIYPDDDNQQISIIDGEEVIFCPVESKGDLDQWKKLVEKETGIYPPDPLCAVLEDDGTVASVIMADPKLDRHPEGKELVEAYSDEIAIGDKYDKAQATFLKGDKRIEKPVKAAK